MRLLGWLLVILALVGVGSNYYQIGQLRRDLRAVKGEVSAVEVASGDPAEIRAALDEAERHSARARKLLAQGKTQLARKELDEGLEMLEKAVGLSRRLDSGGGSGLGKAWDRVRVEIEKAVRDTISEAKKSETR